MTDVVAAALWGAVATGAITGSLAVVGNVLTARDQRTKTEATIRVETGAIKERLAEHIQATSDEQKDQWSAINKVKDDVADLGQRTGYLEGKVNGRGHAAGVH